MNAMHSALAASALSAVFASAALAQSPFLPGNDRFESQPGTSIEFGVEFPPIPPDFFGPGSEPFEGRIWLSGNPIPFGPDSHDTIITRFAPLELSTPDAIASVPIQLVELRLQSTQPIVVTFDNGNPDALYQVFVELIPTPGTSTALAMRSDVLCGEIRYQPQVSLAVFFSPLGPGAEVLLPIGPIPMQSVTACKWGQLPFAGVSSNPTPNLFPRAPFELSSLGGGFVHVLAPARNPDCDGNGVSDADQIAANPMLDLNRNGVLDRCEMNAGVTQISFPDLVGGFQERYSPSAQLAVQYVPSFFDTFWLHAASGPSVITLNAPMLDVNSQGVDHISHIPLALSQPSGLQAQQIPLQLHATDLPLLGPVLPPLPPQVLVPVFEHVLSPGLEDGPILTPIVHGFAEGLLTPVVPLVTWKSVSRRGMEGVDEEQNHCAPGAVARSLDWLQNILCLPLPASNDEAQEMYAKLSNMQHLMTTRVSGTQRTKYVPGITQFLTDKMLTDCFTVMRVTNNDPCAMFDDLAKGCDIVGNISWYKADGTRNGGHAITVSAAIKCGTEVSLEFNDDAHGQDMQDDNKADKGDTKKAKVMDDAANPGRKRLVGYGRNSWDGYIKICPTRKCQIDAVNKWVNGTAVSGVEGIESLVARLLGGAAPSAADKANIRKWAENAYDVSCFLLNNMEDCNDPAFDQAKAAAQAVKDAMGIVVVRCIIYSIDCNLAELGTLPSLLGSAFDALRDTVRSGVDCDMNGIDDLIDIARGDQVDSNNNCVPDICEPLPCPGDYNGSGGVDLLDLLAFNGDWSSNLGQSVPAGTSGDYNGSGTVDLLDLLAFNSDWSANLGQGCP